MKWFTRKIAEHLNWLSKDLSSMLRVIMTLLVTGFCLAGCETTGGLYYWGHYEDVLYNMYNSPDKAPPEQQIEVLSKDIYNAESQGYRVAPGIHAHLGMLYATIGNMSAAEQELTKEKLLYPEASTLVDGMLERAKENMQKKEAM